jgi:hypothetical protein
MEADPRGYLPCNRGSVTLKTGKICPLAKSKRGAGVTYLEKAASQRN